MLGAKIPILQAPIGGSAPPELAAAVANAGAIGGLALTGWTNEDAAQLIARTRDLTDGPFFVNLLLAFQPECMDAILASSVPVVTFSFGDAGDLIARVKGAGKFCGVQVGNAQGATNAARQGADFVICQGIEAGGRVQSSQQLHTLLDAVRQERLGIPVVAAGGIASAQSIRAAMRLGASAVMMGTRFLATQESKAHEQYKRRIVESTGNDTALTVCFMDGWPHSTHRILRNTTLDMWEAAGCPPPGGRPGEMDVVATFTDGSPIHRYDMYQPVAGYQGQIDQLPMYSGAGCGDIEDVPSAAELIERLWSEVHR